MVLKLIEDQVILTAVGSSGLPLNIEKRRVPSAILRVIPGSLQSVSLNGAVNHYLEKVLWGRMLSVLPSGLMLVLLKECDLAEVRNTRRKLFSHL